jgi:hypothetical protein
LKPGANPVFFARRSPEPQVRWRRESVIAADTSIHGKSPRGSDLVNVQVIENKWHKGTYLQVAACKNSGVLAMMGSDENGRPRAS